MTYTEPKGCAPGRSLIPAIGIAALGLLVSCDSGRFDAKEAGAPAASPTPIPLAPAIRFDHTEFESVESPAIEKRDHTTIAGVSRPTLTRSRLFYFKPACAELEDDPEFVECDVKLPPLVPQTPWVVIEAQIPPREEPGTHAKDEHNNRQRAAAREARVLISSLDRGAEKTPRVRLPGPAPAFFFARSILDLPWRALVTPKMTLPGGGVLRTWLGIEEAAWSTDSPPVIFSVGVLRDGETKPDNFFRKLVDPARRPGDRNWIPVEIALPDLGDEPFRLVLETRPRNRDDPRPSLPVWGDPTILRPQPKPPRPRHVVLISLDTLRAQSMSAYGYETETTPKLSQLIREGTLFENAFTTFSNTLGSHMSMLTGLYPANHAVTGENPTLDEAIPTLAQRMRDAGYETAAFTENALLRGDAGFRRGFARYHENKEITRGAGDAEGTFGRALQWARRRADESLFLFVHTYEVHAPHLPPDYTSELLGDEGQTGSIAERRDYEREIRHLDRLVTDFIADLEKLSGPEDLLIVVTADHGEEFLEHGAMRHVQLYDEVMHVPLFLRWPGEVPADLRIETPVSLVDVVPTVLQLVDAQPVEGDGMSLVALFDGASRERVVFGQAARNRWIGGKVRYVARSKDAKCMVQDGDNWVECFDLKVDPSEQKPIRPGTRPELTRLHREAVAYRAIALANTEKEQQPETTAPDGSQDAAPIDSVRQEKLKALGYIE